MTIIDEKLVIIFCLMSEWSAQKKVITSCESFGSVKEMYLCDRNNSMLERLQYLETILAAKPFSKSCTIGKKVTLQFCQVWSI